MQAMRNYLSGKVPCWETTYRIRRKDGDYAWYYDRGVAKEKDSAGAPLIIIGTVQEVTAKKNMEKQLNNLL